MVLFDCVMKTDIAADGFAALGSGSRLQVVRTLVRAGDMGLSVGEIQSRTGMAASTLAHHLRSLANAGLIKQKKTGRTIINYAEFVRLKDLAGFILDECCVDEAVAGKVMEETHE